MKTSKEERGLWKAKAIHNLYVEISGVNMIRLIDDADQCAELERCISTGRSAHYWEEKRDEMYQRWQNSKARCAELERENERLRKAIEKMQEAARDLAFERDLCN